MENDKQWTIGSLFSGIGGLDQLIIEGDITPDADVNGLRGPSTDDHAAAEACGSRPRRGRWTRERERLEPMPALLCARGLRRRPRRVRAHVRVRDPLVVVEYASAPPSVETWFALEYNAVALVTALEEAKSTIRGLRVQNACLMDNADREHGYALARLTGERDQARAEADCATKAMESMGRQHAADRLALIAERDEPALVARDGGARMLDRIAIAAVLPTCAEHETRVDRMLAERDTNATTKAPLVRSRHDCTYDEALRRVARHERSLDDIKAAARRIRDSIRTAQTEANRSDFDINHVRRCIQEARMQIDSGREEA
jgi:hypothetical protein